MTFWYNAIAPFTPQYHAHGHSWDDYAAWYGLHHLKEMVSLDTLLNPLLVEPEYKNPNDWNFIVSYDRWLTGFFTTIDYVLKRTEQTTFNLLAVVQEPEERCETITLDDFEFVGYDILDKSYDISSLNNCTGLNSSLEQADFNQSGLISYYERAFTIRKEFLEQNKGEHTDCYVIAIWRHKTIGRG